MMKYFCDYCNNELKKEDMKIFSKSWDNFNTVELCEKCEKKHNSKKQELDKEIKKIHEIFFEKVKIKEKEILGDLR